MIGRLGGDISKWQCMPTSTDFTKDSEYDRAIKLVTRSEEKLLAKLGAEDKEQFEKRIDAQGKVSRLTATKNFLYGYKLGLIMTVEAFVGRSDFVVAEENC